tara:strand:- start:124 stop:321 length:198 start_codon:yes stop_codon:yes gene_type:complete
MNKQEKENICQGIAEELERDVERYLEWQAPSVTLSENEDVFNYMIQRSLKIVFDKYKSGAYNHTK